MKIEYFALYVLITIFLYFWYYRIIHSSSLEHFSNILYDKFEYNKPFMIIESNKLLALTLLDDNQTVQFKDYKNYNPRQFWVPFKDGTTNIYSQPNNLSCNKMTQSSIIYNKDEMMLKNYHDPTKYLHVIYNNATGEFNYKVVSQTTTKKNRVVNNLDSPIFTPELNDRTECYATNYDCFTCTKCKERLTECTKNELYTVCEKWGTRCAVHGTKSVCDKIGSVCTNSYNQVVCDSYKDVCVETRGIIPQHTPKVIFHNLEHEQWPVTGPINVAYVVDIGIPNDLISGLTVGPGTILHVYEHAHYVGRSKTYKGPLAFFYFIKQPWGWVWPNDVISSFKIEHDPSTFINSDECIRTTKQCAQQSTQKICTKYEDQCILSHTEPVCIKTEPVCDQSGVRERCVQTGQYCQKCHTFTGNYNPLTCVDETNNLPYVRRYKFSNNRLSIVNNIQVPNDTSFNTSTQYLFVKDDPKNTPTVRLTPFDFYFIKPDDREKVYKQYLIRNNLLPGNPSLKTHIQTEFNNYQKSQS